VEAVTAVTVPNVSINNTDGTFGIDFRSGGIGLNNTFIGNQAGQNNMNGQYNTALGIQALAVNTYGNYNVALGHRTLAANNFGYNNIAIGYFAMLYNNIGYGNTTIGFQAHYTGTNASGNVSIGQYANSNITTGNSNTAVGEYSLRNVSTGYWNLAMGSYAMTGSAAITGNSNAAIGYQSHYSAIAGYNNMSFGPASLYSNTYGYHNVAGGSDTMRGNVTGYYNTAIGSAAIYTNKTGHDNVSMGYASLYLLNATNGYISAFSDYSGTVAGTVKATSASHGLTGTTTKMISGTTNYNGSKSVTDIDGNSFYFTATWVATQTGYWSIDAEASHNTALGENSGRTLVTGYNNVHIGDSAGYNGSQLSSAINSIVIGYAAYSTVSNAVILGNTSITAVGIGTYTPTAHLHIVGIADNIQMVIKGYSTQTSNMLEIQDSSSNIHNRFNVPGAAAPLENVFNETGSQYLDFRVESDTYDAVFVDASNNSIMVMSNTAGKVGFYGVAAVAQQVLATGTGKTVDDIITFLQTVGLCKQS
jgi:hypothetical protein